MANQSTRSLMEDWDRLGGKLRLTQATGADASDLIAERCRVMNRVDAHLNRPARLDHGAFFNAVAALLEAHASRAVLAARVFATGPDRPGALLRWVGGDEARSAAGRPSGAHLHVRACGPEEPHAVVIHAELRSGGADAAGECARYLWELWADKELASCPGGTA